MSATAILSACSATPVGGPSAGLVKAAKLESTGASSAASSSYDDRLFQLARQAEREGNMDAALPIYRHLASSGNKNAKLALARGLLHNGAHHEALNALEKISGREFPAEGHYLRGKALLALGNYESAGNSFLLAGGYEGAKIGSGIAWAASGKSEAARQAFNDAGGSAGRSNRALLDALTGRADDAIATLTDMVRSGEAGVRDRQNLALAYLAKQDLDAARAIARLDLDEQSVGDTISFYLNILSLPETSRMKAMITGVVDEGVDRSQDANLRIEDHTDKQAAAQRILEEPVESEPAPEPEPQPEPAPEPEPVEAEPFIPSPRPEIPADAPPLVEPEGWSLQVGAYRTIKTLLRGWDILQAKYGDIIGTLPARRSEVDFGQREENPNGFYFRLNAGPLQSRDEAELLCEQLKERGSECWVRAPEPAEGRLPEAEDSSDGSEEDDAMADAEMAPARPEEEDGEDEDVRNSSEQASN